MKHGIWKDHNVSELYMESNSKLINLIKAISDGMIEHHWSDYG